MECCAVPTATARAMPDYKLAKAAMNMTRPLYAYSIHVLPVQEQLFDPPTSALEGVRAVATADRSF